MGNVGLLFTVCLLLATVWLAFSRFRMRLENSWPLIYYLGVVIYLNGFERVLDPYVVYVAVICALLLRFEFLNERLVFFVRLIEVCALAHMAWRFSGAIISAVG
jgi:hypothetical protein